MADIFQEIDEELRQEKAEKYWQKYGLYVIIVAVGIVVAVAGNVFWRDYQVKEMAAEAEIYSAAVAKAAEDDIEGAIAALSAVEQNAGAGYASLAKLRAASLLAERGDTDGSLAAFDAVANGADTPKVLKDAAIILAVLNNMDKGDSASLSDKLGPLAAAGNPWSGIATELQALLAEKSGNRAKARELYKALADAADTPAEIRARATEMLRALPE